MKRILVVLALVAAPAFLALAQEKAKPAAAPATAAPHVMIPADALKWVDAPPALPPGAKVAILEGDSKKEGFFAMRIKLPAGYKVPPHFHPGQERVTVIEGTFFLGSGDKWDDAVMKKYQPGSYLSMPAGMHHFAGSKEGAVIQLATMGPWGITYINPADDPRGKAAK